MTIYEHEIIPILEEVFKSSQSNIQELSDLIMRLSEELLNTNEGANRIENLNKEIDIEQRKKQCANIPVMALPDGNNYIRRHCLVQSTQGFYNNQ